MRFATAAEIAADVTSGRRSAGAIIASALARIVEHNQRLNAFTAVTAERARARAAALDAGQLTGPLAGVPFAVKNLFDVAGLPTVAGSKINRDRPPATADSTLIARLEAAGAILVGALNMGEYAYDFTGENCHDGPSRNPHDPARMTGGSSGGSGGAVAGGLVPIALGSDTNGSIRVPSSFCGSSGSSRPMAGCRVPAAFRLSRASTTSVRWRGRPATSRWLMTRCRAPTPPTPPAPAAQWSRWRGCSKPARGDFRVATAGGYFRAGASPEALAAIDAVANALGAAYTIEIPEAARARSAAYVITASEGAALHLGRLRQRAQDFDPDVRDRLIAGALIPAAMVVEAQKFRRWYREAVLRLFDGVDAILAPATPCVAPLIGRKTLTLDGREVPLRPNIGIYTQPISFIGLPLVAVAVPLAGGLPIGMQIIAAPWREDIALRIAYDLETAGIVRAPLPAE